jgi:arylsulfatase A-like enzyme
VKKIPAPEGHPFNGLRDFQGEFDWGVLRKPENEYGDYKAVEWAETFLRKEQKKPFFLAVGLWHPHIPMFAPQKYFDMYRDPRLPEVPENDLDDVPAEGRRLAAFRRSEHDRILKEGKWKDAVRAYLASISFADALIGKMLGALEGSAHAGNTIVVLWSDNGWHLGEKQHWHKSTLWERSTHVPLVIAGPGVQSAGVARKQPVSLLDLYPTLVEVCGLTPRKELEGVSLGPLLRDPRVRHQPVVCTFEPGNHAVRDERWRYIRYKDGTEELYDRVEDPNEYRNIASNGKHEGVKRQLAQYIPKSDAKPVPERDEYDFNFATHTWKKK